MREEVEKSIAYLTVSTNLSIVPGHEKIKLLILTNKENNKKKKN